MGHSKNRSKREVFSFPGLPQETRKISNKQFNLTPKGTGKRRIKPKVSRRKETRKIRAEINKIETEETIEKINETKSCYSAKKQN